MERNATANLQLHSWKIVRNSDCHAHHLHYFLNIRTKLPALIGFCSGAFSSRSLYWRGNCYDSCCIGCVIPVWNQPNILVYHHRFCCEPALRWKLTRPLFIF